MCEIYFYKTTAKYQSYPRLLILPFLSLSMHDNWPKCINLFTKCNHSIMVSIHNFDFEIAKRDKLNNAYLQLKKKTL